MAISVFELYTIGVGPSSSHTVGPMRAARRFVEQLREAGQLERVERVLAELFGSLALTGKGHATDRAVALGLMGETPEGVDVDAVEARLARVRESGRLELAGARAIPFSWEDDLAFRRRESLPRHPNGMRFTAFDADASPLAARDFYSVGGGFVLEEADFARDRLVGDRPPVPHPYRSAHELLEHGRTLGVGIDRVVLENEKTWRSEEEIRAQLLRIRDAMQACVERGIRTEGVLPGGLGVVRRAPRQSAALARRGASDPLHVLDHVNVWALAVNEENAAGGRVVTAPTNGAAGILPAVLLYYQRFADGADDEGVVRLLLTAGAIGILYKENASISGAEVGCQGEVGVACSMAAGGLVAALGGSNAQIENAAEIGMEHNLGLTCDPIGGLVQIPCIERNAMGAVKAINAARIALGEEGSNRISLDQVIRTMRRTGADMKKRYKETSRGGLAVVYTEC